MSPSSTPQTTAHQHRIRKEFTRQADTMAAAAVFTDQEILDRIRQAAALTAQLCIEYDPQPHYDARAPSKAGADVVAHARETVQDIISKSLAVS